MTRILILLRHAEAAAHRIDRDRELTEMGREQAEGVARWLAVNVPTIGLALVSPAARTMETFAAFAETPSHVEDRLYNASAEDIYEIIKAVDDDVTSLMIVGHNPGISEIAILLAANPDSIGAGFPPAGLAVIDCPVERWADVRLPGGQVREFIAAA